MESVIALMGQPNAGKSTLFNNLTGAHQHVGNWPGKTVEKKEGYLQYENEVYKVVDLPGTYSLFANSEEEVITRNYIIDEKVDMVVAMVDASQLERSLFLLSDYVGINVPVMVILNMMDVAKEKGRSIYTIGLEKELGVPVIPFTASDKSSYDSFYNSLAKAIKEKRLLKSDALFNLYENKLDNNYKEILKNISDNRNPKYSKEWIAVKILEGDKEVANLSSDKIINVNFDNAKEMLKTSDCKFKWIEKLIKNNVSNENEKKFKLSKFDKIATSKVFGKPLALLVIILGLIISMIIAMPLMQIFAIIPVAISEPITKALSSVGIPNLVISLVNAVITAMSFAFMMCSFVLGISLVFGFLEEIGYMARISYVFDNTMSKLGLQGKAIMPFLVSFGCNIGGVSGTRVIDSWKQRVMAIALSWVVPCSATWSVVGFMSGLFFGSKAIWVIISLFIVALLHMIITSKIFGRKLIEKDDKNGLIMELPPYHRPKYKNLFRFVFNRMGDVLRRALKLIIFVSICFWALSYSPDNNLQNSIIYKIGLAIEPVTMWFGLKWQTFMALIAAAMGKEAALGVLASLFNPGSHAGLWSSIALQKTNTVALNFSSTMLASISKAQALAFIYAFFFNIPCLMALAATVQETHSLKYTLKITVYYIIVALIMAFAAYHVGLIIF